MRTDVIDIYKGNDIKSYDSLVKVGVKGIIHKASEGSSMQDSMYAYRRQAQKGRFLWGAYHFNSTSSTVSTQVDNFLKAAAPDKYTLLCLDWEGDHQAFTVSQGREFMSRLMDKTGRKPSQLWIYGGNVLRERIVSDKDKEFFGAFRLWHCQYGTSRPNICTAWKRYDLWQYSETGMFVDPDTKEPATGGFIDLNVFNGTMDEMKKMWAPGYETVAPGAGWIGKTWDWLKRH